ncbi:S8 family peptidase [Bradyrhizobium sp. Pear76]|uniref:S8 family peptidase n=1 Tax=Bradyrhizobium oropedii TaxID=1571201 RepID=UPI001E330198|nr:S8 family peptidase [Bradyrhizobium oropedii]MCC8964410.1 S8 family peptidase [Bradyrhizobium oropedii]
MPSRFNLPHIDIGRFSAEQDYASEGTGGDPGAREREEHGRRLQGELAAALALADQTRPQDDRLPAVTGSRIEVELRRGTDPEVLNLKRDGIRAGASKYNADNGVRTIALYVPDEARSVLEAILDDYLNGELLKKSGKPPKSTKVEAIEEFRQFRLASAWTDDPEALPPNPQDSIWWALWCHRDLVVEVETVRERLDVKMAAADRRLLFPEIVVIPVYTTRATVELMLFATGGIAELRRATDNPAFYTDEISGDEHEWVDGLAERIVWPGANVPSVCIFDTGVNRGHALIEPALAQDDLHALDDDWNTDDHHRYGHGTGMAGLVLHGDLTAPLGDTEPRTLRHRLESVKILPPRGFDPNDPRSYGVLTQAAVALPEFHAPERGRIFCMAVTNENVSGATASTWSAAIDQAAVGRMIGDGEDEDVPESDRRKRLFIVSAGNTPPEQDCTLLRPQDDFPIEDPAQAWNALTIGGCTDLVNIHDEGFEHWTPMASVGTLSPHSRTSTAWRQGISPIKPELVIEAGNRAIDPAQTACASMGSLSLLTTGRDVARAPLVPFDATSAAAAQGARMAAQIQAQHPEYWPETVRAMMVHSAEWTPAMLEELTATQSKRARYAMVRRFGYGVPSLERALASANNHVALFAQAEIQPFKRGGRKFNKCHYYTLPIPPNLLEGLGNERVELKVTLSYFIDPNPGLSANVDPQRYQSHGMRFDHQRRRETVARFKQRVNTAERPRGMRRPTFEGADPNWMLGEDSISAGSLHCDVWTGPAIDLLDRDTLCVKPVNGWWRNRASLEICNRKSRYALIVTLRALNPDVDIYTPIRTGIGLPVPVPIEIEV